MKLRQFKRRIPMKPSRKNKIPITSVLHTMSESIAIAHKIYDSIVRANIPVGVLMALGNCIRSKIEWNSLPVRDGSRSTTMQLALIRAVDEFLMPELSGAFVIKRKESLPTKLTNSRAQKINSPSKKSSQTKTERSRKKK
jgi:hypothetical protein